MAKDETIKDATGGFKDVYSDNDHDGDNDSDDDDNNFITLMMMMMMVMVMMMMMMMMMTTMTLMMAEQYKTQPLVCGWIDGLGERKTDLFQLSQS